MVLYFSATGNSEYAAKRIGEELEDEVLDLFERIRGRDYTPVRSERPWVVVTPTYAWRIPRLVEEWLSNTELEGNRDVCFVMTCGQNIGNARAYLERLCGKKKLNLTGCFSVVMPDNYLVLFPPAEPQAALAAVEKAEPEFERIAGAVKAGTCKEEKRRGAKAGRSQAGLLARLESGPVNRLFYSMFISAKKFYATDACISCRTCEAVCPLSNIRMENGRPVWGDSCTHCMACLCRCPAGAVEYGSKTKGLLRYTCPKKM